MTTTLAVHDPRTIGERLQRRRLEVRALRIEQVLVALDERVHAHKAAGFVPPALARAIRDFRLELVDLHDRLAAGAL